MTGIHIHSFGKSGILTSWETIMNRPSLINRIYFILAEGAGYIENGQRYRFRKGHVYLLSHAAHAAYFIDDYAFSHIYINYTDDTLSGYERIIDIAPDDCPVIRADAAVFAGCVEREMRKKPGVNRFDGGNERIQLVLSSFLADIAELYTSCGLTNPVITESVKYIHSNYASPITVGELAGRAFLSKNRFSDLFSAQTGITPYQYIRSYRFDVAIDLLKAGIPVGKVAEKCGFESCAAFSNSFRKKFGFPPTKILKS